MTVLPPPDRRSTRVRGTPASRSWVRRAATAVLAAGALALPWAVGVAHAETTLGPRQGLDVSHPQCGATLPSGQAFALVGVDGGTATTRNPCLAEQLAWAEGSTGATVHDEVQLYVNTANPGPAGAWPQAGSNRYGECDGSVSEACAYQYGWDRAVEDATERGVGDPQRYMWWLDVEIGNTWDYSTGGTARNVAVLEGMTEYFTSIGGRGVGLYSTRYQWDRITGGDGPGGGVAADSSLVGLSNWRPAGSTLEEARAACSLEPLTPGGVIELTQYTTDLDYAHTCI